MSILFEYATAWFRDSIAAHTAVERATALENGHVHVQRKQLPDITVAPIRTSRLTSDIVASVLSAGEATVVVLVPKAAHYDWAAREYAQQRGSTVQTVKEVFRALTFPDPRECIDPTVELILRALGQHSKVSKAEMICEASVSLERSGGLGTLIVAIEYEYEFTVEAAVSARQTHPSATVILNTNPNGNPTQAALDHAEQTGIPIFGLKELMGALNFDGERFRRYRRRRR